MTVSLLMTRRKREVKTVKFQAPKIGYSMKLAGIGLVKNAVMTLSSIFVLFACLAIMGTFFLVMKNINHNIDKIDGYNKIVIFVDREADAYEVKEIENKLNSYDYVESVEFVSKDEALENQIAQYSEADFLRETYKDNNPLKDSFYVTYKPTANVESLMMKIENEIDHISKINVDTKVVEKINSIKNAVAIIFSWLLVLLFVVSLFVIINTIKLSVFSRRDEIALMRHIGATNRFVSTPFLMEGLAIGIIAATVAFIVQYFIYKYLILGLAEQYEIISLVAFSTVRNTLIGAFALIGIATGVIGSYISLKKYNKEH